MDRGDQGNNYPNRGEYPIQYEPSSKAGGFPSPGINNSRPDREQDEG
jgi:hypothetical protein